MLLGKTKKTIEAKENEMKLYLSNNYKDKAYQSYKELLELIETLHGDGKVNDKDYAKLVAKTQDFGIQKLSQFIIK